MLERCLRYDNKPLIVAKTFNAGIKPFCATLRNTIEQYFQVVMFIILRMVCTELVFCNANVQPIQMNANNEQNPTLWHSVLLKRLSFTLPSVCQFLYWAEFCMRTLFLYRLFYAMLFEMFTILNLGVLISKNETYGTFAGMAAIVSWFPCFAVQIALTVVFTNLANVGANHLPPLSRKKKQS